MFLALSFRCFSVIFAFKVEQNQTVLGEDRGIIWYYDIWYMVYKVAGSLAVSTK